jgi:hypothetical protein
MRMAGIPEKRKTYTYCQETKLVRIVLEHVNKEEYGDCIKRVLDSVKLMKMMERVVNGEDMDDVGVPDNHERSFSDDWLPSWAMFKASLLEEWTMRCNDTGKQKEKEKGALPVAMGGVKGVSCYGCGIAGHKKGDPGCKAGKFDAHPSAPKDYRKEWQRKERSTLRLGVIKVENSLESPGRKIVVRARRSHAEPSTSGREQKKSVTSCMTSSKVMGSYLNSHLSKRRWSMQ